MRLTLIPIVLSLATSFVSAYGDDTSLDAREYIDELVARDLQLAQVSDLSTRDLIDELSERLEIRERRKVTRWKLLHSHRSTHHRIL
ncbi:hypothetical protein D9611_014897 [Ephemerocybe angulata]|uniref:Uncharacterized protein n=1 Tax=Ephemerocybe angulata TaxID=980116 RepID=A0A8H5EZE2_9AGAR|nr:hypothetical protein D9611_014897 [Tulosesus angulatus]